MRIIIISFLCLCAQIHLGQSLKTVNVDHGSLSYYTEGKGAIILFIHGAQEDYRMFLPQVAVLRNKYKVVTYSRRYNFPNDNKVLGDFSAKTEAEDVKVLVEKLGKPIHLVGHSYGGLIAIKFALDHPSLVKSLILSEPALVEWLKFIPNCESSYQDVQETLINDTREAFKTQDTTRIMKELFEFFAGADVQDQVPANVLSMLKANLREMEAIVHSKNAFEAPSCPSLQKLNMPVMIFTSERTMPLLKCTNRRLSNCLSEATHHHLEEAGHDMWMTHPEELSAYISDFINN